MTVKELVEGLDDFGSHLKVMIDTGYTRGVPYEIENMDTRTVDGEIVVILS